MIAQALIGITMALQGGALSAGGCTTGCPPIVRPGAYAFMYRKDARIEPPARRSLRHHRPVPRRVAIRAMTTS
jgi:hypothetical protein